MEKVRIKENNNRRQRVITFLKRDEVDFLDRIGKDAYFSTGMRLPRAKFIAWIVNFVKKLQLDGEGLKSERDLEKRIVGVLKGACRNE